MDEKILLELKTAFDGLIAKRDAEVAANGAAHTETKNALQEVVKRMDAIEVKMAKPADGGRAEKSIVEVLQSTPSVEAFLRGEIKNCKIHFDSLSDLERKTAITDTALGSGTAGVLMPGLVNGIVPIAERKFRVRGMLPATPTTDTAVYYVKENVFTNAASPQVEASAKAESALTFTTGTATVRTVAHWIPVSRQALSDMPAIAAQINRRLIYGLKYKEESELLSGSNTGEHLNGLITQATAFSTALLAPASAGWNKADVIRRAMQQVESADESASTFIVMNTVDWADIELAKDTTRQYLSNNAFSLLPPMLWGVPVVVTNAITAGTFLVGSREQAQIFDRMGVTVDISEHHSTYFTENMVAVRCEERLTLAVYRPAAFITGTFTTSP